MRNLARVLCAVAALTASVPALAQAQTTTAFDGTYRGVSRTIEGGSSGGSGSTRACISDGVDSRGTVTGRLNAGCSYQYVWQKQ